MKVELEQEQLSLPEIPHLKRIAPNDLIRSSLFTVGNHRQKREYLKQQTLYSFRNTEITFTGEELRQDDEDVWLQLISLASESQTNKIEFLPYSFIRSLGWPQRTQYKDKLKEILSRLSATDVGLINREFKDGFNVSLVRKFAWTENGENLKVWRVWLEPEVVRLFSRLGETYTKINWDQRNKLKPLAKWLHAFYSSHEFPLPMQLTKIMKLCGSKTKSKKHFKPIVRNALVELVQINFITPDFFIDAQENIHVTRVRVQKQIKVDYE
jgi:hypothetical protein